jgi:hypothetical protein
VAVKIRKKEGCGIAAKVRIPDKLLGGMSVASLDHEYHV